MNEKREPARVLDWIASEPWAITQAGLDQIVSIASRQSDIEAVEAKLGKPLENTRTVTTRNGVATIPVHGPIFRYANMFTRISGATAIQDLAADFTAADENPDVRAIVLSIDSPGGTVNGVGEFARMVKASKTPVTAYIGNMAASAAFWIAAAADERVAFDAALIGSVGAVLGVSIPPKPKDGGERHMEFVSSVSPKKRVDIESDAGKAQIQQWVDDTGEVFVSEVASMLGMKVEDVVAQFGQGDILIAAKAKEAGMVDRIATYEEVVAELSAKTAKGNVVRPRFAAKSTAPKLSAKGNKMSENENADDLTAQFEAMKKQLADLQAKSQADDAKLQAEATARISAEVETFKASLLTGSDLRFNADSVKVMGDQMLVAKAAAAGLPSVKVAGENLDLNVQSLGTYFADQVNAIAKVGPKFAPPADGLTTPKANAGATGDVSLADFSKAALDPVASKRISAVVAQRKVSDPSFTAAKLEQELRAITN